MNIALDVQNLSKAYGKKQAVNDVSFQIMEGEIFGLMGMNGAGKTTILRMLATLLHPDSGDALIAGHSVKEHPEQREAQKVLAEEVTRAVHGEAGLRQALKATDVLFGGSMEGLSADELENIFKNVKSGEL